MSSMSLVVCDIACSNSFFSTKSTYAFWGEKKEKTDTTIWTGQVVIEMAQSVRSGMEMEEAEEGKETEEAVEAQELLLAHLVNTSLKKSRILRLRILRTGQMF